MFAQPGICGLCDPASLIPVVFIVEEFVCITEGAKSGMATLWLARQEF
jgi:hypothetical protein